MNRNIYIYGYGNLGWHLEKLFLSQNIPIGGIFSSKAHTSNSLIDPNRLSDFINTQDFVFISVNDDKVIDVADAVSSLGGFPVICSGSIPLNALKTSNSLAFYPLYSFTKSVDVNWHLFPVFVESTNDELLNEFISELNLDTLNLVHCKPGARAILHLAGVFTNSCAAGAMNILNANELPFNYLFPILQQTINKIIDTKNPKMVQTGPAQRNDLNTLSKQMDILESFPSEQAVYLAITKYIQQNKS